MIKKQKNVLIESELINSTDEIFLEEHGLDKDLWTAPLKPNEEELERQIAYLIDYYEKNNACGITQVKRHIFQILVVYVQGNVRPPSNLLLFIAELLGVNRYEQKYAKRPKSLAHAQYYIDYDEYDGTDDLAKKVGVHPRTVQKWIKKGMLKGFQKKSQKRNNPTK